MDPFEERLKKVRFPRTSKRLDERILGARYNLSVLPTLLSGETVLLFKRWVWLGSVKALPSYRVFFSLPPLSEVGLYVTDRRVLIIVHLVRLLSVEFSQWFQGQADAADHDILEEARIGRNLLGVRFLEIVSYHPKKSWWRWSPRLRLRLYMRDPQAIRRWIPLPDSD